MSCLGSDQQTECCTAAGIHAHPIVHPTLELSCEAPKSTGLRQLQLLVSPPSGHYGALAPLRRCGLRLPTHCPSLRPTFAECGFFEDDEANSLIEREIATFARLEVTGL